MSRSEVAPRDTDQDTGRTPIVGAHRLGPGLAGSRPPELLTHLRPRQATAARPRPRRAPVRHNRRHRRHALRAFGRARSRILYANQPYYVVRRSCPSCRTTCDADKLYVESSRPGSGAALRLCSLDHPAGASSGENQGQFTAVTIRSTSAGSGPGNAGTAVENGRREMNPPATLSAIQAGTAFRMIACLQPTSSRRHWRRLHHPGRAHKLHPPATSSRLAPAGVGALRC